MGTKPPPVPTVRTSDVKQRELKRVKQYKAPLRIRPKRKHPNIRKLIRKISLPKIISYIVQNSLYSPKKLIFYTMLSTFFNWFKQRAKEPSTYQGLTALLGVIGFTLTPELWEAITSTVVGIISLIQVIKKERLENAEK